MKIIDSQRFFILDAIAGRDWNSWKLKYPSKPRQRHKPSAVHHAGAYPMIQLKNAPIVASLDITGWGRENP
jgi:hypothetical protein